MNVNKFYRWIPGIALVALTIGLMFFFKNDRDSLNELVHTAEATFTDIYTKNLKPLFYTNDISNEEVFNFAMNENLLINKKEDEYLQIGSEDSNAVYFEIKKRKEITSDDNYERFVNQLNLDEYNKNRLDSILNSYKDQIYAGILSDTISNSVAVNPKLLYTHSALVADIMNFAEKAVRPPRPDEPPKPFMNETVIADLKKAAKEKYSEDYIFITPDTVFQSKVAFNKDKMRKDIEEAQLKTENKYNEMEGFKMKFDFENEDFDVDLHKEAVWVVNEDSGNFRIVMNQFSQYTKNIPELRSAKKELDSISVMLRQLGIELDINSKRLKVNVDAPDGESSNVVVDFTQIDSLVSQSMNMIFSGNKSEEDWEEFGRKMDSIAERIEVKNSDSTFTKNKSKK